MPIPVPVAVPPDETPPGEAIAPAPSASSRTVKACLVTLALIAVFSVLGYAEHLFMPIVLAFIVALTLSPVNRWLQRRSVPSALAALLLVGGLLAVVLIIVAALTQPVTDWIGNAPQIGRQLEMRLRDFREPLKHIQQATAQVANITDGASAAVPEVVVKRPGLISQATSSATSIVSTLVFATALVYFLLMSHRLISEKIVRSFHSFSDKKRAIGIVHEIERTVSQYLLTITIINACLGVAVGTSMWVLGMPNPLLFGTAAMLLNYLPYVGPISGVILTAAVAMITFPSLGHAMLAPLAYLALITAEGNFITPMILGARLQLNPVAILLSIGLWGFLWGIPGILLGVPILVVVKVFCDHLPKLEPLGAFLSGASDEPSEEPARPTIGPTLAAD